MATATPERMCPHCNRPLPEEATFCNECGRRVEGWQGQVAGKAAPSAAELPDGEVATREMQVSPEMLRAAGKSTGAAAGAKKVKQVDQAADGEGAAGPSDSMIMRSFRRRPWVGALALVGIAVAAGAGVFLATHRAPATPPASGTLAPPVAVDPPTGASPTPPSKASKKRGPRKLAAETVGKGVVDGSKDGPLPKKGVTTDSKAAPSTPSGSATSATTTSPKGGATATKPSLPDEDLPSEATPMTEEEMKQQEEARLNADQVRYVVKQHLSQVRACYERQFKQESPGGRVEVSFAIGTDGKARRVRTDLNTTGSEPFARCIEGLVGGWTFPRPVGGEFELTYPFVFSSGS